MDLLVRCTGLETATKFSFLVEQSFYIRPGRICHWSLEGVGEQTCVIESSRVLDCMISCAEWKVLMVEMVKYYTANRRFSL